MLTYLDWSSKREDPGDGASRGHFFSVPIGISKTVNNTEGEGITNNCHDIVFP